MIQETRSSVHTMEVGGWRVGGDGLNSNDECSVSSFENE